MSSRVILRQQRRFLPSAAASASAAVRRNATATAAAASSVEADRLGGGGPCSAAAAAAAAAAVVTAASLLAPPTTTASPSDCGEDQEVEQQQQRAVAAHRHVYRGRVGDAAHAAGIKIAGGSLPPYHRPLLPRAAVALCDAAVPAQSPSSWRDRVSPPAPSPPPTPASPPTHTSKNKPPASSGGGGGGGPSAVPQTTLRKTRIRTKKGGTNAARNVMLHRMRSLRARNMNEKYNVDWKIALGEGAYGSVHPARLAATGEKVALKKMKKRYTNTSTFRVETDALLRIYDNGGHPNVAGLRDMYEDYSHFYLVMDLVSGGEMFEHLINYGAYSEADAARLMQEVASALAFLHGVGVVHADLKPENLLLCSKKKSDGTIKLIDFGCAVVSHDNYHDDDDDFDDDDEEVWDDEGKVFRPKKLASAEKEKAKGRTGGGDTTSAVASTGTTAYWAPERFERNTVPDAACDMWSAGIILYIMLTGAHPFDLTGMSTDEEIEERIQADPRPPLTPELTSHLSPSAIDLIRKLMEENPDERLTAIEMLQHPWICGETAETKKMADSAKKLAKFKDLRTKVEAGIFSVLVAHGNRDATLSEAKVDRSGGGGLGDGAGGPPGSSGRSVPTNIMKRAFEVFDAEGKGFVSSDDLGRVVGVATGSTLSPDDHKDMLIATGVEAGTSPDAEGLSLSEFTKLFSRLKHKHFPRGHVIFRAGEAGDSMYFINSGKVEIQTRKGQLVAILRHGDFFGEGSLLEEKSRRFTTAKASTPVDVIKIDQDDFTRYMANSLEARHTLKRKWRGRLLTYAKNLIRLQTNVKERTFQEGEVVYNEGDVGKSMFFVDDRKGGTLEVKHGDVTVHEYHGGESFGESSLLFERPRSSTVICASETCTLHEMLGSDFLSVLESSPDAAASLRDMCRKRLFKKAVKAYSLGKKRGLTNEDIVAAFHEADKDKTGLLSFDEIRDLMHTVDPTIPEREIVALLKFIDVDEDGYCSLEEFKRLFRSFEDEEQSKSRF